MRRVGCMTFSLMKRRRERPRRTVQEVIKGDLMINNILETLAFNQTK